MSNLLRRVTTLAGSAGITGATDASGAQARFVTPYSILLEGQILYCTNTDANFIVKIE